MSSQHYSVQEYAALIGYSPRHIYRLIRVRRIRAQKLRNRWVITAYATN